MLGALTGILGAAYLCVLHKHTHDWLLAHARQRMAYTALILGAYLAVSGLIRLS